MQKKLYITTGIILLAVMLGSMFMFQLREGTVAVVTRVGKPHRTVVDSGPHSRLPWPIESVYRLDSRKHIFVSSFTETLTSDKRNVILSNNAVWYIEDPLKLLRAVGTRESVEMRLDGMITNAKNAVMGNYNLTALVSMDEDELASDQIEREILEMVAPAAKEQLGIIVEQVGILRVALPEVNITQVFDQMRAERQQYAATYRAEGQKDAAAIISDSDLEKARILAEANQTAAEIIAGADAEAARIYAEAHASDPEFYYFIRSLQTLERALGSKATLILDTGSRPFSLLEEE